jgi:putative RecB family exonuclease
VTTIDLPHNLSYSQKTGLSDCGGRYYLEKGQKVPQRPAWANVGGTAAHSTTEELDRRLYEAGEHIDQIEDIRGIFESFFVAETEKYENVSGFGREEFRSSGRASREWPEKESPAWWAQKGPEMCAAWVRWRDASPFQIATIDRMSEDGEVVPTLAIEVECHPILAEVEVVAFIDRLMVQHTEAGPVYLVNDLKFGSREPSSPDQLVTYRFGLISDYGIDPQWGTFWMGRKAMSTPPADLQRYTREQVEYDYRMANEQRLRGDFRYKPSNLCNGCSVNAYCPIFGGEFAHTIPQPWELTSPPTLRPPKDRV